MKTTRTLCLAISVLLATPAVSLAGNNEDNNDNGSNLINSITHHINPSNHPYAFTTASVTVAAIGGLGYITCPWIQRNIHNPSQCVNEASRYIGSFFCNKQSSHESNNTNSTSNNNE